MSDLISRQTAINTLEELKELDYELYIRTGYCHLMEDHWDFVIKRYKEAIKETPCAQQKQGHWIDDCGGVKCSCCGYYIDDNYYAKNYCTNCGAKMKEAENE